MATVRGDHLASGETAGGWDAAAYARHARFVADLGASLIDWLEPRPGERILDLGCGDGALTAEIGRRGAAVVGVDGSAEFVAAARDRGIDAHQGDGQNLTFDAAFDGVFSNAAIHWMKRDPEAVRRGVFAALKPGGRFVAEFGVAGNVVPIHEALRAEATARGKDPDILDPWVFEDAKKYLTQLESSGFSIERELCFERPTVLPGDVGDWLETLARPFVHAFAEGKARREYVAAVRARLAAVIEDEHGQWTAPYVRLRFVARKPAIR